MIKYNKIYVITNLINNHRYVGYTNMPVEDRFYYHAREDSGCWYLRNAIQKYGKGNFSIEEVFGIIDEKYTEDMENYFMDVYNTLAPNGYNLKKGGYNGFMSEITKDKMRGSQINRWANSSEKDKVSTMRGVNSYVDKKKRKIVGVDIILGTIILRFDNIMKSADAGYFVGQCLAGKSFYSKGYCWFYDDGEPDSYYQALAESRLGGFGNHKKNKTSWDNPEKKAARIESLKKANAHLAKPIIGVNRFDLSILEFPGLAEARRQGITGNINDVLTGNNKHCHNYCWFYKESLDTNYYIEEAKKKLGDKFDNTNIKAVKAVNINSKEELKFNTLFEAKDAGFRISDIRRVLRGDRPSYKGYIWKYLL